MNKSWEKFLLQHGAEIENGQVISIGESQNEFYSLDQTYLCDLSTHGVIRAQGEDAHSFLHGQFTNDLDQITESISQISSYCNPKGRMLSIFRIFKNDESYFLVIPKDVIAPTLSKLNMYKLMSKVDLIDATEEFVVFGMTGSGAESVLEGINLNVPRADNECVHDDGVTLIKIPGEHKRILIISDENRATTLVEQIIDKAQLATSALWDLHDIHNGIPKITAKTCEAFIPQMTNLDIIGGVNFQKGCYPGQEVVARTHYLGKPNRRMYRAVIDDEYLPDVGTNIFSPENADQPVGKIVNAQKISDDNSYALVVLRIEKENSEDLHLESITGPKISLQSLPYSLDSNSK